MTECKHGLRSGCAYCHAPEKMNDRMTALKKRLREIRGS
jgi:hypothetical protein